MPIAVDRQAAWVTLRPEGLMTVAELTGKVSAALEQARRDGARGFLVDVRRVTFPGPVTLLDRWALARAWARAGGGRLRLACLARPDQVDPGHFGVTVARNNGQPSHVFLTEDEAIDWLNAT